MSEAMTIPPVQEQETKRTPTVYFIDDSATMREVIKIAFRRESINVITCADAASALAQFEQHKPDVVITDVIMPDQDGYSVCSQIKQHPEFGNTPVVLMSGVVNKSVADKAVAVKADELIRKPFQPQELIGRVKSLLEPKRDSESPAPDRPAASAALNSLFAPPPQPPRAPVPVPQPLEHRPAVESAWPRALAEAFSPPPQPGNLAAPAAPQIFQQPPMPQQRPPASSADIQKLRTEIARLELLVKKLQTEMQIEKQYTQALELQIQALTRVD
jgi:CheY-like chemotaxis protein